MELKEPQNDDEILERAFKEKQITIEEYVKHRISIEKGEPIQLVVKNQENISKEQLLQKEIEDYSDEDYLKILKMRYSKGEISKKKFESMKKNLEE